MRGGSARVWPAAHDKGVLHRDLKPANIMIDGRGQVLITDFGLAALAGQIEGTQVRDGTPAYMSPEQLAGKEVSVRSDIYALGLVLHEMFTGKRRGDSGATPSTLVKDLDPAVERVILRCLEADPRNRPASALGVAAALPGGDPLAAALAAGETPTPGMVAAAGNIEGIPVWTAAICLAWILVGLVAAVILGSKVNVLRKTPFPYSPEVLAQKASEMIQSFGYATPPADRAYAFVYDSPYYIHALKQRKFAEYRERLAKGRPPLIYFWYRESPRALTVSDASEPISPEDPPPIVSGMIGLSLDPIGSLIRLDAMPPQVEENPPPAVPIDWKALFTAAGLDMTRFTSVEPQWLSLANSDARAAWTGSYASAPEIPMRIEAASWRGKPVFFRVIAPWTRPDRMQHAGESGEPLPGFAAVFILTVLTIVLVIFLGWRNFRAKRGDIRGANKVAVVVFAGLWLGDVLGGHHVASVNEVGVFFVSGSFAVPLAFSAWALYLLFEPYVRRRWPQSMITWSRMLNGGFHDPLVGGHLLFGVALGIGAALLALGYELAMEHYGAITTSDVQLASILDGRRLASFFSGMMVGALRDAMLFTFVFMLLRVLLRRQWLAAVAFVLIGSVQGFGSARPGISAIYGILSTALIAATLLRFGGLLPMIVAYFVSYSLRFLPLTTDFSSWYASATVFVLIVILALTAYAFHTAVAGRPLFKAGFLEPD